jgi:hypothetical protein
MGGHFSPPLLLRNTLEKPGRFEEQFTEVQKREVDPREKLFGEVLRIDHKPEAVYSLSVGFKRFGVP